jgi:hypothetical protein
MIMWEVHGYAPQPRILGECYVRSRRAGVEESVVCRLFQGMKKSRLRRHRRSGSHGTCGDAGAMFDGDLDRCACKDGSTFRDGWI